MNRLCCVVALVSTLAAVAMGYLFGVKGDVVAASDGRTSIHLTTAERDFVLAEMRTFLSASQQIVAGLAAKDDAAVSLAAKGVGMQSTSGMPVSLMGKLPLEFKKLGMATHKAFDQLAMDSEAMGDVDQSLQQLETLMKNCVACHAAFRFDVVE